VIVFVHGVPETARLWDGVRAAIGMESLALTMPGFGCERPEGFGATKDDYVSWLVEELDRIVEPVHLVGHDWGAALTYRVATAYGDQLASWSADVANVMHPDYVWHDLARFWQTPGAGESLLADQRATSVEIRAARFETLGVNHDDAVAMAGAVDETMGSCILDLYRSALPNPYAHWRDKWGPTAAPGMVLWPSADPFGDESMSIEVAAGLGAHHETLEGMGHWWPLQAPAQAAVVLASYISSIN